MTWLRLAAAVIRLIVLRRDRSTGGAARPTRGAGRPAGAR